MNADSVVLAGVVGVAALVIVGGAALLIREHDKDTQVAKDIQAQRTRLAYMVPSTLVAMAPAHTMGKPYADPFYPTSHDVWGSGPWAHRAARARYAH